MTAKRIFGILFFTVLGIYVLANVSLMGFGEWLATGTFIATWLLFKFVIHKDITGDLITGMIVGATVEYLTEAYWDYSMKVYIYKDISVFVIMGWGYSFTYFLYFSRILYKKLFNKNMVKLFDKRIILCDALVGPLWFIANEYVGMNIFHLWTYSSIAGWTHIIPVIHYPLEGVIGSIFFSITFPTFVRYWQKEFDFDPHL
ncbi:MAG: hypothetical protein GF401_00980 [Chitinivibrionales bacterium]|nr:hypothetical protein [Chitinivibrionales bacterium]